MKNVREEPSSPKLCSVCFKGSLPQAIIGTNRQVDPDQTMLTCRQCALSCHRICYNSQLPNGDFLCDCCQVIANNGRNATAKVCFLCRGTEYLLKRVDGLGFAHPVCLLERADIAVRSYRTLEFLAVDYRPSTETKDNCALCKRPG